MIAMMYLVYTALLALNVSVEILNGFVTVGDAMNESNKNIETQIVEAYDLFDQAMMNDSTKAAPYYEAAMTIKGYTDELKSFIDSCRLGFLCNMQSTAEVVTHNADKSSTKRKIPLRDGNGNALIDSARVALDLGGLSIIDKKDNTDIVVQKAVELGVSLILPVKVVLTGSVILSAASFTCDNLSLILPLRFFKGS